MPTRVTPEQLIDVLLAHPNKGAKNVAIRTRTLPKLTVKSRLDKTFLCPWPQGIARLALRQVKLGAFYENAVNKQRDADGHDETFEAGPMWNGKGVFHTRYTVQHKDTGEVYMNVLPAQRHTDTEVGSAAVVCDDEWIDVATGRTLDFERDRLAEFLPGGSKSQSQDVEHDVQWRVFKLSSIVELRFGGMIYTLV